MKYNKARAEVVLFDNSDVITVSDGEFTGNCPHESHIASGCDNGNHKNKQ